MVEKNEQKISKSINPMKNKGSILITTLWIMAILSLLAIGIGFRVSLEVRLSKYNMDRLEARSLAKAGIAKTTERLLNDIKDYDCLYECGIVLNLETGETPESIFSAENNKLGNGSFSIHYTYETEDEEGKGVQYGIIDEERKININLSNLEKMANYKEILKRLSPNLTDEIISAIIDWQDTDNNVTLPSGAEDFDYEAEYDYSCKDAELETIEEVFLVKGMTVDLFYEIRDYITVYSSGQININTAPKKVLSAIIDDGHGTFMSLVEDIVDFRKGDDGVEGTDDDRVFMKVDEIMLIASEDDIQGSNRLSQVSPYFVVKSNNFRIISHGKIGNVTKVITCVVKKEAGKAERQIKYYHEG